MAKLKTTQDFIDDIVGRIRHEIELEFGEYAQSEEDKLDTECDLREIRHALETLSFDEVGIVHSYLLCHYSLDCPCEHYRVDINGHTGEVKFIELNAPAKDDPKRIVLTLTVSDDIAPGSDSITRDAYERLLAQAARSGMTIDEVLDDLIATALPPATHN